MIDQTIAMYLVCHHKKTLKESEQTSAPQQGYEPAIPVKDNQQILHRLDPFLLLR
jgi:hypothetical protein